LHGLQKQLDGFVSVQLGDAVDAQGEGRRGLEVGLMVVAVDDGLVGVVDEVAVGIGGEGAGDGSAAHGEGAGIEDVDLAGLQIGDGSVNRFLGAGRDVGAELGQRNGFLVKTSAQLVSKLSPFCMAARAYS